MEETEPEAISAQRQQLISGLRSDDKNIYNVITGSDQYSPGYAKKKGKSKPIDLFDTGAFNEGVFAQASDKGLTIDSSDDKSTKLQTNYGKEIFGFGTGAKVDYLPVLRKKAAELLAQLINGNG